MKEIVRGMLMLALILLPMHSCLGETLAELREEIKALGRWTQTYEAHGRTIDVDIPVIVPEVESMPITNVSSFPPYNEEELADSERFIEFEDRTFYGRSFENVELQATMMVPTLYDSVQIEMDSPAEKRSVDYSNDFLKYERSVYYPWEIDDFDAVFAEENDMSLGEACEFIGKIIHHLYGESEEFAIDYIEVRDRARKTKNMDDYKLGNPVEYYPSGTYMFHLYQQINGVPVYAYPFQLFDPYKIADRKMSSEPYIPLNGLLMNAEIMNPQSYNMHITMLKKESIVEKNPSFVPVSKVISAIEKEIEAGRIRNVYSLRLGYVCYLSRDGKAPYTLYPTWICECDYTQTAKEEGSTYDLDAGIHEGSKFVLVGVNAVTGELFDRRAPSQELIYCPE